MKSALPVTVRFTEPIHDPGDKGRGTQVNAVACSWTPFDGDVFGPAMYCTDACPLESVTAEAWDRRPPARIPAPR